VLTIVVGPVPVQQLGYVDVNILASAFELRAFALTCVGELGLLLA